MPLSLCVSVDEMYICVLKWITVTFSNRPLRELPPKTAFVTPDSNVHPSKKSGMGCDEGFKQRKKMLSPRDALLELKVTMEEFVKTFSADVVNVNEPSGSSASMNKNPPLPLFDP